jgi:hypothetical protein
MVLENRRRRSGNSWGRCYHWRRLSKSPQLLSNFGLDWVGFEGLDGACAAGGDGDVGGYQRDFYRNGFFCTRTILFWFWSVDLILRSFGKLSGLGDSHFWDIVKLKFGFGFHRVTDERSEEGARLTKEVRKATNEASKVVY